MTGLRQAFPYMTTHTMPLWRLLDRRPDWCGHFQPDALETWGKCVLSKTLLIGWNKVFTFLNRLKCHIHWAETCLGPLIWRSCRSLLILCSVNCGLLHLFYDIITVYNFKLSLPDVNSVFEAWAHYSPSSRLNSSVKDGLGVKFSFNFFSFLCKCFAPSPLIPH